MATTPHTHTHILTKCQRKERGVREERGVGEGQGAWGGRGGGGGGYKLRDYSMLTKLGAKVSRNVRGEEEWGLTKLIS